MNGMVRNLLTLNQLEFGNEKIEFMRVNLTEIVKNVLQSMEIVAQQKQAEIRFDANADVYVWADEYKVEQVVRNYISNAFHHVDGEKRIEVRVVPKGSRVRVSVFNTGAQIPEEDMENIWIKFYKVDKARTREYGGSGIGLSIVKAIMEAHN
jgi:signal transduction histidine kinase